MTVEVVTTVTGASGEQLPPSAQLVPLIVTGLAARLAPTKESVASLAVASPVLWVVAVVPFGSSGVPLRFAAVPLVLKAPVPVMFVTAMVGASV